MRNIIGKKMPEKLTKYETNEILLLIVREMNVLNRKIKVLDSERTLHVNLSETKNGVETTLKTQINELQNNYDFLKRIYGKLTE
jgi:hypothetical protein